jgi:protein-disulfide isomerase
MSKQFWGVVIIVILIFVGIFALSGNNSNSTNSKSSSSTTATNHVEGLGKDGITLVEYGDYQCPYCAQYYSIVKQVQAEYNTQLTFQFRNFPLVSLHPNAFAAARAAEAAGLEGKFWQMHDLLYEQSAAYYEGQTGGNWVGASDPTPIFNADAQELGLNVTQFKTDYAGDTVNNLINADMAAGNKLNIQGTPTFFLDGKQIQVGESASSFEQLINAEIAKKTGSSSNAASTTPASTGTTSQSVSH